MKTSGTYAYLALSDGSTTKKTYISSGSSWTRYEVTYTNSASSSKTVTAQLLVGSTGTVYMDCAQLEREVTASRYNLITNGDFRYGSFGWAQYGAFTSADACTAADPAAAPNLENTVYTISLYDNHDKEPDKVFHEEILAIDYSEPSISLSDATVTLGSASVTVLSGGWELENVDLSVLDVGYAEVSAGLEDGQLNVGAMASLWAPSVTFTLFDRDVTISGHFGSIGATLCVGTGKIKVGVSYGIGFSLSLA